MNEPDQVYSTGSIQLDRILGGSGVPGGSIVEVFGDHGTGKTTVALQFIQSVQSDHGRAMFIDAEHALNAEYARRIGVSTDDLIFSQPDSGEQALDIAEEICRSGAVNLIVIDSAASLVPGAELEDRMDEDRDGRQARMLARFLRKLSPGVKRSGAVLLFTNQLRTRVGASFGPDETTPGGNALKFYTSIRIKLEQQHAIRSSGAVIGSRIRVQVVKNRTAPPYRDTELDLLHDRGICPYGDLLDACLAEGIIERNKSTYRYGENILGMDRASVRSRLEEKQELRAELYDRVRGETSRRDSRS